MCCGKLRQQFASRPQPTSAARPSAVVGGPPSAQAMNPPGAPGGGSGVAFEYAGATALTVVSPVTGKTYRFGSPGARIEVDSRDRPWVTLVPEPSARALMTARNLAVAVTPDLTSWPSASAEGRDDQTRPSGQDPEARTLRAKSFGEPAHRRAAHDVGPH